MDIAARIPRRRVVTTVRDPGTVHCPTALPRTWPYTQGMVTAIPATRPGGGTGDYKGHSIDAGVSYNKALSFSRRTTLGFSTGTAAVNDGIQTHYSLIGNVQLTRELGRIMVGWRRLLAVRVLYRDLPRARAHRFVVASIGGLLSRETQFEPHRRRHGRCRLRIRNGYESYSPARAFAGACRATSDSARTTRSTATHSRTAFCFRQALPT